MGGSNGKCTVGSILADVESGDKITDSHMKRLMRNGFVFADKDGAVRQALLAFLTSQAAINYFSHKGVVNQLRFFHSKGAPSRKVDMCMAVYRALEVLQTCEGLVPENHSLNDTEVPENLRAQVDEVLPELSMELLCGLTRLVMRKQSAKKVGTESAMTVFLYSGVVLAKAYVAVLPVIREAVLHSGAAQLAEYKAQRKAEDAAEKADDCDCCKRCGDCSDNGCSDNGAVCGVPVLPDGAPQLLRDLLAADTVNDTDRRVFVCKAAAAGYTAALHVAHKKWCFTTEDIKAGVKSAADTGEMGAVAVLMEFNKTL